MPRTLSFPPPSTATCPICSAALSGPRCGSCGASFAGADGATLWRVDHDLFDLCRIRNDLVHRLLTTADPHHRPTMDGVPTTARVAETPWGPTVAPAPAPSPSGPGAPSGRPTPGTTVSDPASPAVPAGARSDSRPSRRETAPAARSGAAPGRTLDPAARSAAGALDERRSGTASAAPTVRARSDAAPVDTTDPADVRMSRPVARSGRPAAPTRPTKTGGPTSVPGPDDGPGRAPATALGPPVRGGEPPAGSRPPRPPRPRPSFTAAEVLVGLGALSLVAAVAVFAAVSWSDLAAWAQGSLIVALTGAVLATATACRRRHLVATSESLGAVGVALGLADVQVARVALDGMASGRLVWAVGVALVAAGAIALGRRTGIRVLGLAGGALAFAPLVVATTGGRPLTAVAALAAQAVAGGAVATRLADRRLDRAVAATGAVLSWCGAVGAALVLAAAGLGAEPTAHPTGPAVVLAALAAATTIGARRLPAGGHVVGGAGTALAFVPAVLLALGTTSVPGVLAVLAGHGVLALALAATDRLARGERAVAVSGGVVCWVGAAVGLLVLAGWELVDGDPTTEPIVAALVLAAQAAGSIVAGRRSRPLVAGGMAIALAPALLVAAATGSALAVAAVAAAQAVVALALVGRFAGPPRVVAIVGGAVCWIGAAGGAVALTDISPVGAPLLLAVLAACSFVLARRDDELADPLGAAGSMLAFLPAVLLAATASDLTMLAVGAAQAVVALALVTSGWLRPVERTVAVVGGAVCWIGAAAAGVALTEVSPLAPLVLAALAACSIVLARRADDEVAGPLGSAGSALAFVPGLLLAASTGSWVAILGVAAAQAVVGLFLAGVVRDGEPVLTEPERTVARALGWALWVAAAAGAVLHAAVEVTSAPDDPDARIGALLVAAALSAASLLVGPRTRQTQLTAAGAGLAFLPVPLLVLGVTTSSVLVGVLGGEALVAALLATVVGRGLVRNVLVAGGVAAWVGAVTGAGVLGLAGWLGTPVREPTGAVALLLALAALAVGAALMSGWDREATSTGLGAAVVPVLLAVAVAAGGLGLEGWAAAILLAAGALAVGLGLLGRADPGRPWSTPSVVALAAGAVAVVVPARAALAVVAALLDRATTTPDVGAGVVLTDWLRPTLTMSGVAVPGWATVAQLAGMAGLAGAVALLHPRAGRGTGTIVAVTAAALVPVATGLTVAVTVAGLGAVVVAVALVVRRRPRDPELLVGAAVTATIGTAVAIGSAPWTVGWTVLVGLVVAGLTVEVVARRSPDAPVWVGAAVGVVLAAVALDAWVLGVDGIDGLLVVALAAAAVSPFAGLLERRDEDIAADVVDVLVGLALVAALLVAPAVTGTVFSLSPFVAVVGVTAAGAALRPRRRPAWMVAAASAVLLTWLEAGRAEVDLVEAYTLPLAAWALVVGAVAGRRLGSWERFGIGLVAAVGPSAVLALVDPDPARTVGVVAVGVAVAVWGAASRLQAPLAVGAAAVGVLAVRHLGPVSVELPRYVTFAVAGLVLLAVGATFEQRRQDLRQARDAFVRLR